MKRRMVLAAAAQSATLLAGCGLVTRRDSTASGLTRSSVRTREHQWARTAWRYVENNADPETGLAGGSDRSTVFTVSNMADHLAAIVCAHELDVIDAREFDQRLSRVLGFLGGMDLSGGLLPNKAYHALTGKPVNFEGRQADMGWSAIDIGRLLIWLKITGQRYPQFQEYADKAVLRWNFCQVINECGTLYGATRNNSQLNRYQEGRFGYEQLAAAGYAAWGFTASDAASFKNTHIVRVDGVDLLQDVRDDRSGVPSPVLSMPFMLMGIELGWTVPGSPHSGLLREQAQRLYRAQEQRWRREKQLTARSDWQSRDAPWVVLDSVFAAGYAWNTVGGDNKEYENLALVNTRAAFALAALWPGEYAERLIEGVRFLFDPDRGWYEGRLEAGGGPLANITLATNAAVLEVLLYQAKGPLLTVPGQPGHFAWRDGNVFARLERCLPSERAGCAVSVTGSVGS